MIGSCRGSRGEQGTRNIPLVAFQNLRLSTPKPLNLLTVFSWTTDKYVRTCIRGDKHNTGTCIDAYIHIHYTRIHRYLPTLAGRGRGVWGGVEVTAASIQPGVLAPVLAFARSRHRTFKPLNCWIFREPMASFQKRRKKGISGDVNSYITWIFSGTSRLSSYVL